MKFGLRVHNYMVLGYKNQRLWWQSLYGDGVIG